MNTLLYGDRLVFFWEEQDRHARLRAKVWCHGIFVPTSPIGRIGDATALLYGEGMRFLEKRRQRKAARKAATEAATAAATGLAQQAEWQSNREALAAMLQIVHDCRTGKTAEQFTDTSDYGFMLKKGEFPVAYLQKAGYLENVREPTKYRGGYGGVSFPIFGRVRLNAGRTGGKITPGAESINATDIGPVLVTNQRVMFAGSKRTREWRFDKMMSCSHLPAGTTIFAMTTSGKPAGIAYGEKAATEVQFRIELASALALDTLDRYYEELLSEQQQLEAEHPITSPPTGM